MLTFFSASLVGIGLLYLLFPGSMVEVFGISGPPEGLTDLRATYGGAQIGIGIFLFWCLLAIERYEIAYIAMAIFLLTVGLCRSFGLVVKGMHGLINAAATLFEISMGLVFVYVYRQQATA